MTDRRINVFVPGGGGMGEVQPGIAPSRGVGDPPDNDDARGAWLAYHDLVAAYGRDRVGLPRPGRAVHRSIVCSAHPKGRQAHTLARVFTFGDRYLFVGAKDFSRGTFREPTSGTVVRTFAYVIVAARFLDASDDGAEYPVRCPCRSTIWLAREKLNEESQGPDRRVIPDSAVLSRYD